jgi:hypothetical protein
MTSEMAVSQLVLRNLSLPGAKKNFTKKSKMKTTQMVILKYSRGFDKPQTNSITNNTNQTKPRKTIGPSSKCSMVLSSFFLSLAVLLSIF